MTTRTITVNTPEETEVQICDECGLGSDEGELVEFPADDDDLEAELHYHRSCAKEQTGNPQTLSDAYHEAVGADMEYSVALVLTKIEVGIFSISVLMFLGGLALAAFPIMGDVTFWLIIAGLSAISVFGIIYVGRDNGQKTAEELV